MTRHSEAFKSMLSDKRVMGSLLRAFGPLTGISPSWTQAMDMRSLSRLSPRHLPEGMGQGYGGLMWRVRLRHPHDVVLDRSIIVVSDVRSTIDPMMSMHINAICNMLQLGLSRNIYAAEGKLTPIIPFVVYNGKQPWNAPTNTADLYYPVDDEPVADVLGSLRCYVLDIGALAKRDLPEKELMSCLVRQQNAQSAGELWSALREAFTLLDRPNSWQRRIRRDFYDHARLHPLVQDDHAFPTYESLEHELLKEDDEMTTIAEANAERWHQKVRGESREEMLHIMTAHRFGARTAATLIERFGVTEDPERLVKIGEWIYQCETGKELLARAWEEWGS